MHVAPFLIGGAHLQVVKSASAPVAVREAPTAVEDAEEAQPAGGGDRSGDRSSDGSSCSSGRSSNSNGSSSKMRRSEEVGVAASVDDGGGRWRSGGSAAGKVPAAPSSAVAVVEAVVAVAAVAVIAARAGVATSGCRRHVWMRAARTFTGRLSTARWVAESEMAGRFRNQMYGLWNDPNIHDQL